MPKTVAPLRLQPFTSNKPITLPADGLVHGQVHSTSEREKARSSGVRFSTFSTTRDSPGWQFGEAASKTQTICVSRRFAVTVASDNRETLTGRLNHFMVTGELSQEMHPGVSD